MTAAREVGNLFFERIKARDLVGALALVNPETKVNLVPLGIEGSETGVLANYFERLQTAFPDLRLKVRRIFAGSDGMVVAEISIEGTQAEDFYGIVNQEKLMDLDQVWLMHVDGEKIDQIRAYWCQNRLYRRLGVKRLDHVTITA